MFIKFLMSILVFLMFVDSANAGIFMRRCCNGRGCTYQRVNYSANADLNAVSSQLKQDNSNGKVCTDITTDDNYKVKSTLPDPSELYPDLYAEFTGTPLNKEQPETTTAEETLLADDLENPANIKVDFMEGTDDSNATEDSSEVSLTKANLAANADTLFEKTSLVKDESVAAEENVVNKKVTKDKKEVKEETDTITLSKDEIAFIDEINKLRTSYGLSKVVVSKKLMEAARKQSDAMSNRKMLYHYFSAIPVSSIQNIAKSSSVSNVISEWKFSNNGNFANIINPRHKYVGVANTNGFFTLILSGSDIYKESL